MRTLAVLSLAAGIGLAAALASVVDAILLRPLPVARPWEISQLFTASEGQPLGFVSYFDFEDLRRAKSITGAVAECLIPVAAGNPVRAQLALAVTPDYFQVLGVPARFGRTFAPEDQMAAVLARGSSDDLGTALRVGAARYTVIGVAPEGFGLDRFLHPDFYIPIRSYGDGKILQDRSRRFLTVHIRGTNAAPEMEAIAARLEREYPQTNRGRRAVVLDERTARLRTDKTMAPLASLLGALALLILAIGCTNACVALLIRAEARTKITSIKIALGASPMRLLGERMRQAAGISALSCAAGLMLARLLAESLRRSIVLPSDFSISIATRIDGRLISIALAAALLATLICGIRIKPSARRVLAIIEIALATALTATGASLWMGLNAARHSDLGYRSDGINVVTFDPAQAGYSEQRTREFYRDLLDRVKLLPGVRGVALAQSVPLGMTGNQKQVRIGNEDPVTMWMNIVTPDYFTLMRIGVVAGRIFDDRDGAVAVVNEELAKRIGVGERMQVAGKSVRVIGIVRTAKYMRWDEAPRPFFYLPPAQNPASRMTLFADSPANIFGAVRNIARDVPMSEARPLRAYFDDGAMFGIKAAWDIAGVVGVGGLLLALAGLYGVVSSAVSRRCREIAIRVALGAPHSTVFAMIVRQGMQIAVIGSAAGTLAAQFLSHLLRGFVPGPMQTPASASLIAVAIMLVASLISCVVPAIKVLRMHPAIVLRSE